MAKKQLVTLTNKQNKRLHKIKDYLRLKNVNDTFSYLVENFEEGIEDYLGGKK